VKGTIIQQLIIKSKSYPMCPQVNGKIASFSLYISLSSLSCCCTKFWLCATVTILDSWLIWT